MVPGALLRISASHFSSTPSPPLSTGPTVTPLFFLSSGEDGGATIWYHTGLTWVIFRWNFRAASKPRGFQGVTYASVGGAAGSWARAGFPSFSSSVAVVVVVVVVVVVAVSFLPLFLLLFFFFSAFFSSFTLVAWARASAQTASYRLSSCVSAWKRP